MRIAPCGEEESGPILAILNDAIVNTTALYDYRPRNPEMMKSWFAAKARGGFPVLGAFADHGGLVGFGSYGTFRAWPAYKYSVEHSIYVDRESRGRGIGAALLAALIQSARDGGFHVMIGAIDASNSASIALHRRFGFNPCGTVREAGFKFGRWLDLDFYQLILPTPDQPVDG